MADANLVALTPGKHPFQLDCTPWPQGPYEVIRMTWESIPAFFARLDMPGCYGVSRFKKGNSGMITFNARAPKKEGFPYDESERVYAGCFNIAGEALVTPIKDIIRNGCFFMFFPVSHGTLFFLPPPRSPPSSGIFLVAVIRLWVAISLGVKCLMLCFSWVVIQGSVKSEKGEGSSSGKSIAEERDINLDAMNLEGSGKSEQKEGSSEKSMDKPQGSTKSGSGESASNESSEEESTPVENSSEQSSHEAPEIAIGSTTEDVIGYVNQLKIQGPDGVCEKRVVQEDGRYSVYVRADLPGLEPCLCTTTVKNSCILVYGKLPPKEVKKKHRTLGARSYLFFVQLRCSCCKFDNLCQHHADGVLRLFCNIRGPEPGPSAD
ncbi:hypothetical protein Cgig2_018554 [Carnegiea gigantea]|uniref:SHSP domain-containing protein n=1 Tax=Carnegiea gigantea TaxID=171969 RepID=A0A9Q1KLI3_9CARY|nr:hypothetical protein Cgig2_018554 [Carnegiea gigantea]